MNAASWVALVGLFTTMVTALGGQFLQGKIAARNASTGRLQEQRWVVFGDAMIFAQDLESRLDNLTEDYRIRSSGDPVTDVPHVDLITARLRLVAPDDIVDAWGKLRTAWRILAWKLNQDGPSVWDGQQGHFYIEPDSPDAVRVRQAIQHLVQSLSLVVVANKKESFVQQAWTLCGRLFSPLHALLVRARNWVTAHRGDSATMTPD